MEGKVFCIGFNKTGTHTFRNILRKYNITPTVHNGKWQKWARSKSKDLFLPINGFTDGQRKDFHWLDKTFPNSKFILNTRPLESWLLSRWCHVQRNKTNKGYQGNWLNNNPDVVKHWIKERDLYHRHIISHFKNRPNDFVIIDLETMSRDEIKNKLDHVLKSLNYVNIPKTLTITKANITNNRLKGKGRSVVKQGLQLAGLPIEEWKSSVQTSIKHSQ